MFLCNPSCYLPEEVGTERALPLSLSVCVRARAFVHERTRGSRFFLSKANVFPRKLRRRRCASIFLCETRKLVLGVLRVLDAPCRGSLGKVIDALSTLGESFV